MQRTCCQQAEVVVTAGDVQRIARHLAGSPPGGGPAPEPFWEWRRPTDPDYFEPDPEDPNWVRYTIRSDGKRAVLKRGPSGCGFLGERGCALPEEVRPLVCRLYPFGFTEQGLAGDEDHYCPKAVLAPDGRRMVDVLGMQAEDARRWHEMLYRELRTGGWPA
jgi:Fe-S-cluster containining protein